MLTRINEYYLSGESAYQSSMTATPPGRPSSVLNDYAITLPSMGCDTTHFCPSPDEGKLALKDYGVDQNAEGSDLVRNAIRP